MSTTEIFKKSKHGYQAVVISSITLFLIYFSLWYEHDFGFPLLILGSIGIVLFINIYGFNKWRCPNCKTYLGSSISIDHCPKCNCSFTEEKKLAKERKYVSEKKLQENYSILKSKIEIPEDLHNFEKMNIYN